MVPRGQTCALAQINRPPIGANITPTAKKSGRTVLGVRMGLGAAVSGGSAVGCGAIGRHVLPGLETLLAKGGICRAEGWSVMA